MDKDIAITEKTASTSDMGATKRKKGVLYNVLAVLFFALAAGGLFLGLLGNKVDLFAHKVSADGVPLQGSLFGLVFNAFYDAFGGGISFADGIRFGFLLLANDVSLMLVGVSVVVALVLAVLSFIPKLNARKCAIASGTVVAIAYGWVFLHTYALMTAGDRIIDHVDLPLLIIAGITLLLLAIDGIATAKSSGFFGALLLVDILAAIVGIFYPVSIFYELVSYSILETTFLSIVMQILLVVIFLNFVISVARLSAKHGAAIDLLRTLVQLIAVIVLVIICIATDPAGMGRFSIFTQNPIAAVLVIGTALIGFLLGILLFILQKRRDEKEDAMEEASGIPMPAASHAATPATAAASAPAPAPAPAVAPTPVVGERVTPVVVYPMPVYPAPMPAPAPAPTPAPTPAPAPAPAPEPAPAPAPMPMPTPIPVPMPEPEPERELSEFERRMAAMARGESEPLPAPAPAPVRRPSSVRPQPVQQSFYDMPYMYDPFLNTLTPQEKNEFGDLFIGMKRGSFGLPMYVIGGNNEEFFRKIFIYLGKYRSYISESLLGKIYDYVNAN